MYGATGLWSALGQVVEVARQREGDDETVGAASGPDDADLMIGDADGGFVADAPGLGRLAGLSIPDLYGLVYVKSKFSLGKRDCGFD